MFDELVGFAEDYNLAPKVVVWLVVVIIFWYMTPMAHFSILMKIIMTVLLFPITWIILEVIGNR